MLGLSVSALLNILLRVSSIAAKVGRLIVTSATSNPNLAAARYNSGRSSITMPPIDLSGSEIDLIDRVNALACAALASANQRQCYEVLVPPEARRLEAEVLIDTVEEQSRACSGESVRLNRCRRYGRAPSMYHCMSLQSRLRCFFEMAFVCDFSSHTLWQLVSSRR